MKEKNNIILKNLMKYVDDSDLVNQMKKRLLKMNNWECHRFIEYLQTTFRKEELTYVLKKLTDMPEKNWKQIAIQQSGNDVYDREGKTVSIDNDIGSEKLTDNRVENHADRIGEEAVNLKFTKIIKSGKLEELGLSFHQTLTLKLLFYVFDGNYSATASLLGVSPQAVRKSVLRALKLLKNESD